MTTQTNFNTRKPTWNGLGTDIRQAQGIYEALALSGLDWNVYQQTMTTEEGIPVTGYLANIRDTDDKCLASSPTNTRSYRTTRHSPSPKNCWDTASITKLPACYRKAEKHGYSPKCRSVTRCPATGSSLTLYSTTHTTVPAPSK